MLSTNVVEVEELFNSNSLRNTLRTRNEQKTNGVPYIKHHHPHGMAGMKVRARRNLSGLVKQIKKKQKASEDLDKIFFSHFC
jgi:hypothetical protein